MKTKNTQGKITTKSGGGESVYFPIFYSVMVFRHNTSVNEWMSNDAPENEKIVFIRKKTTTLSYRLEWHLYRIIDKKKLFKK